MHFLSLSLFTAAIFVGNGTHSIGLLQCLLENICFITIPALFVPFSQISLFGYSSSSLGFSACLQLRFAVCHRMKKFPKMCASSISEHYIFKEKCHEICLFSHWNSSFPKQLALFILLDETETILVSHLLIIPLLFRS